MNRGLNPIFLIIFALIASGCNETKESTSTQKKKVQESKLVPKCNPEPMPAYDYRASVQGEMTPELEAKLRIKKKRDVFKPCRSLTYKAQFLSEKGDVISNAKIKMTPSGKRWELQKEKQDETIVEYEFNPSDIERINQFQLNKKLIQTNWQKEVKEGIIENVEQVWMHPFRSNQYNFTEVAPFPQVELPLKEGKKWTDNHIHLKEGWGDWSNMKVKSSFEVIALSGLKTPYGIVPDCWRIQSTSTFDLGESTLDFWFNESIGFVKFVYTNYGGQKLIIELAGVQEKGH